MFFVNKEIVLKSFVTLGDVFEDDRHIEAFCTSLELLDRHNLLNRFSDVEDRNVFPELSCLDLSVV